MHGGAGHVICVPNSDHARVRDIRPMMGLLTFAMAWLATRRRDGSRIFKPLALADLHQPISAPARFHSPSGAPCGNPVLHHVQGPGLVPFIEPTVHNGIVGAFPDEPGFSQVAGGS